MRRSSALLRLFAFAAVATSLVPWALAQDSRNPLSATQTDIAVMNPRAAEPRLVATNTVALAAPCSEREPNETTSQATPVVVPSTCTGTVASTDAASIKIDYTSGSDGVEDVFLLNLPAPAQLTINLAYSTASADLDVFLFRVTSENRISFISTAAHDAAGAAEKISMPYSIGPGTYYVGVSAYTGSTPYTLEISAPGFSDSCTPSANSLCLANGRFRIEADYLASNGDSGKGQGVLLTADTGYFWFFNSANVEVILKVLDACPLNSRFWVFSGGMTDVNVKLKVTDTITGQTKQYENAQRTAYKTITDTGAFATCNPTACSYDVSPSSQSFNASGGTGSVSVTAAAGCAWTASASDSWISITGGSSGSGNGTVSYSVSANSATSSRSGTLTVAGKTVAISQATGSAACTYSVSPMSLTFPGTGGTATVNVTTQSGCTWSASATSSWLSITSGSSGTGNGTVTVAAQASNSTSSRTGTLNIAGKTVSATQDPGTSTCTFNVTFNPRSFTWCGGDTSYTVSKTDGCAFDANSSAAWIQPVLIHSRTGGTTSAGSFIIAANNTGASRSGTVTIAGQSYTITQAARSGNGQYDGIWSGTTGASKSFSACVADGAVQAFSPTVVLDGTTFTCTTQIVATTPLPISGSSFSGKAYAYPEVSTASANVAGSFSSSTSMSGSWTPITQSGSAWVLSCGSSIAIGIGGGPLDPGTFTATKQP